MSNRSQFFTITGLRTTKVLKILFPFIILTFLWIKYDTHWKNLPLTLQEEHTCSLDYIPACQTSKSTNRTFLYIIWGGAGFCSEINQLLLAFVYSVTTKRQFLIDSRPWNYGNFADYFHLPSSNYYPRANRTFLIENNHQNDQIDHLKTTRVGSQVRKFWLATRHVQSIAIKRRVAHYLWKSMTTETLEFIVRHRIQNLSNYIGIHIRKGDKLQKEAGEIPLNRYITAIERILQTNRTIEQIFVSSDDSTVVNRFRQLKPIWNFSSLYDHDHPGMKSTGHVQSHFNRLAQKQVRIETRLFMCELQMLINSSYVLCGMSSNVCRLLQILRHQHPSTAISIDRPWYGT